VLAEVLRGWNGEYVEHALVGMSARSEVAEATRRLRAAGWFEAVVATFAYEVTATGNRQ